MIEIWAVTDGRAGNESQALGLAEAVAQLIPARVSARRVTMPPVLRSRIFRFIWTAGRPRWPGWPFSGLADAGRSLAPPWPELVIGAGGRSAPIVAAMRSVARDGGQRLTAVQLMHPRMDPSRFDLVLAPSHDRLEGRNVIQTFGALNRITEHRLEQAAERWSGRLEFLPRPRVAVLIGGPSWSAGFGRRAIRALLSSLERAINSGVSLMITPSRRTPERLIAALRESLALAFAEGRAWMWDGEGENPYFGLLGLADAIVVTEDSISMTSEAASTGRPVLVSPVDRISARIRRFQDDMREAGYTRPFTGEVVYYSYEPLRETARVATHVAALVSHSE